MKKYLKMLILSMLSVFLVAGFAMAFPYIEVEGYVDPNAATITDNGDGTSTLEGLLYTFTVTAADANPSYIDPLTIAEMKVLSLEFEDEVFTSVSYLSFVQPSDWTSNQTISPSGSLYEISSAGTTLALGESLQFTLNVTMYTAAITDSTFWQEGQVWGQSWTALDTIGGGDGGSTTPVPEPSTILLLGSGLLGLVGYGRKRFSKKS